MWPSSARAVMLYRSATDARNTIEMMLSDPDVMNLTLAGKKTIFEDMGFPSQVVYQVLYSTPKSPPASASAPTVSGDAMANFMSLMGHSISSPPTPPQPPSKSVAKRGRGGRGRGRGQRKKPVKNPDPQDASGFGLSFSQLVEYVPSEQARKYSNRLAQRFFDFASSTLEEHQYIILKEGKVFKSTGESANTLGVPYNPFAFFISIHPPSIIHATSLIMDFIENNDYFRIIAGMRVQNPTYKDNDASQQLLVLFRQKAAVESVKSLLQGITRVLDENKIGRDPRSINDEKARNSRKKYKLVNDRIAYTNINSHWQQSMEWLEQGTVDSMFMGEHFLFNDQYLNSLPEDKRYNPSGLEDQFSKVLN